MLLAQQHLEHHWQLLGRSFRAHVQLQPQLEYFNLLTEEAARHKVARLVALAVEQARQLADAHVQSQVPALPERVLAGGRQRRMGDGRAVRVEQVPGNGVGDGREYPVEFAHHGASVAYLAGYFFEQVQSEPGYELARVLLGDVPVEGGLDWRGQTRGEQVDGQVRVLRQELGGRAGRQMDRVFEVGHAGASCYALCVLHLLFELGLAVALEAQEGLHDEAGVGALPHVYGRCAHPCLHFVQRQRYVLGEFFVEDPDFAVDCGTGHAVTVVVEQDAFFFGVFAQRNAQFFHVFGGRVWTQSISENKPI
ncbi:hypothetical protein BpHYR1_009354 [Brachionus plicatilis]|uniref:Uncharacterized protein n=1 Tax=Brachionus plicatilis TaxID=10195 RepID=A0A3M7RKS3_BRAPC|nr:hypothetical protein BpHYR1_009354 [Brachionus plicatilis]